MALGKTSATRAATGAATTKAAAMGTAAILCVIAPFGLSACAHAKAPDEPVAKKEKRVPAPKPVPLCAAMDRVGLIAATGPGRFALDGEAAAINLLPACGPPFINQRVTGSISQKFTLVFDDVRTTKPAGSTVTLSFAEAAGDQLTNDASTVGTLTLSAAIPGAKGGGQRLSFDVTRTMKAMAEANHFEHLVIALKPATPPAATAVSIGKVQIVER